MATAGRGLRWIAWSQLIALSRNGALTGAMATHAAALMAFVLTWGQSGVPLLAGTHAYSQLHLVQLALLVIIIPWATARLVSIHGDNLVRVCAIAGLPPSRVVLGQLFALLVGVLLVAAAALPIVILTARMSAVPASVVLLDQMSVVALAFLGCSSTLWWITVCRQRLAAWLASSTSVAIALTLAHALQVRHAEVILLPALAGALVIAMARRADATRLYLSEDRT